MIDFSLVKDRVKKITDSSYYEGDFGDVIEDVSLILSNIEEAEVKNNFPSDYLEFIKCVGFGELDSSFYLDDGPSHYMKTYGRNIDSLDGMYIFASDQSEYVFAFDSKNNWQIVDIDSSGEVANIIACDFAEFIDIKLNDLIETVDWREKNF